MTKVYSNADCLVLFQSSKAINSLKEKKGMLPFSLKHHFKEIGGVQIDTIFWGGP